MSKKVRDEEVSADVSPADDPKAFEALVREHTSAVYAHAYRFFGDAGLAEDATQEVWLKVFRSLDGFDERSSFSTWLYRVTRNVCLDMFRAGRRVPAPADPVDLEATAGSSDPVAGSDGVLDLEAAIRELSPEDRDAFNAVALFGLPYAEAGAVLGVPAGTVKSRVFRARRSLITLLRLGVEGGA